jgi:anti-anti-sigma factor
LNVSYIREEGALLPLPACYFEEGNNEERTMIKCEIFAEKDMITAVPVGKIRSGEYPEIEEKIAGTIGSSGSTKVLLNMENVNFINSAGIIFLLRLKKMIAARGGAMVMYNLHNSLESRFVKLRLDKVLNISKNAEQCLIDIWYMDDIKEAAPISIAN